MPEFEVTAVDIGIFIAYVLGIRIVLGWCVARTTRGGGSEDYFLGGRNMISPIVGHEDRPPPARDRSLPC